MAKRVTLKIEMPVKIDQTDLKLLARIDAMRNGSRHVYPSARELSQELGVSPMTLNRHVRKCREDGFITVRPRTSARGGSLPNAMLLTNRGREVLDAARDQGAVS